MKMGWTTKRIGDVCEVVNGGTPKTSVAEYWGGEHLWITPAEMGKRESPYADDTERKLTDAGLRDSSARMLPPYSVILSSRAPIGHLVINTKPMSTNQGCKGLIPGSQLKHKFLYYYLSSIVEWLDSLGTGATFRELSGGKLKEVSVPVPPLTQQQRIVGVLDEAFTGLATAQAHAAQNLQNARALFESHLQSVFTHRGRGWVEKHLGDICEFVGGSQPPKAVFLKTKTPDSIRLIQIRDYKSDKHIVYIPKSQAKRFCTADDIMIGRYGPPIFQILRGLEGAYNVALMKAVPDRRQVNREFLFYFLKHPAILEYVVYHAERAAGQIGVTKETLASYPIALPSLEVQAEVAENLDALAIESQRLVQVYMQKQAALEELKKSILNDAFSGNL
jgi:type I restriction enzyme S subunit